MTTQHESLDNAIKKIGNRYLATMLIAKRIRQLQHGAPCRITREEGESIFSVAVREIAAGHIIMEPTDKTAAASSNGDLEETEPPEDATPA